MIRHKFSATFIYANNVCIYFITQQMIPPFLVIMSTVIETKPTNKLHFGEFLRPLFINLEHHFNDVYFAFFLQILLT